MTDPSITPSDPNAKITYRPEPLTRLEKLVTRLEAVFGHDTTHAQKQAQHIAIWHENGDDDAYEAIDWDFVIRVLSTHHE